MAPVKKNILTTKLVPKTKKRCCSNIHQNITSADFPMRYFDDFSSGRYGPIKVCFPLDRNHRHPIIRCIKIDKATRHRSRGIYQFNIIARGLGPRRPLLNWMDWIKPVDQSLRCGRNVNLWWNIRGHHRPSPVVIRQHSQPAVFQPNLLLFGHVKPKSTNSGWWDQINTHDQHTRDKEEACITSVETKFRQYYKRVAIKLKK